MMNRREFHDEFRKQATDLNLDCDVLSDGPIGASVAVVGEGPGESEVRDKERRPFIGGAGRLLWDNIRPYGLHRANVYTTNVVKRQISLSRKGDERHIVHRNELDKWIGMLKWELEHLPNLRTIFVMGNYALEALTGNTGITNWRGSVIPNGKGHYVITINPAYAQRELRMEPMFKMDCDKLNRVVNGTFKPYKLEEIINPTFKEAMAFIRDLSRADKPVGLDVEHHQETWCYGLSNDPYRAMCINFRDAKQNRFTGGQEADLLVAIQNLCDSHKIVVQQGGHEIYWCRTHDLICIEPWFDTLLGHHLLYPQWPHTLAFMCAQYTTHPFYKDEGKTWKEGGDIDQYWRYNCKDAAIMVRCQQRIHEELKKAGLEEFFFSHVMRAQPHVAAATVHGMACDIEIKEKLVEAMSEDVAEYEADFHRLVQEATGENDYFPNPRSPPQMRNLFFDKLRLKGRGRSTDETNRTHMLKNPETKPIAKELIGSLNIYIEQSKFLGTFVKSRLGPDNRMRCEWRQFGVKRAPGRLSSAMTIDGQGMNMQNQPVKARAMYVADPGMELAYFDLAQAEAVVVAYRANIPKWKAQFERARKEKGYDAHRALASDMFKVAYELVPIVDWDEDGKPTIRYVAKRCRHGLNYRMERWKLSEVTGLPYHTASRAFVLYHNQTPELKRWWAQEEKVFRSEKVLYNAFGRRLKVIQRIDDDVLDSIIAFYPQSTIGDKVVKVWYQSESDDKWPHDARICLDVHDNLVAITPPRYTKTCLSIMKKYAEQPIMVQDAWKNKAEPVFIAAETKASYPTKAIWNEDKRSFDFIEDKKGLHRWSHMRTVEV